MSELERTRIRDGLCPRCGDAAAPGLRKCAYHHRLHLECCARIRAARVEMGLCSDCDSEAAPGRRRCKYHLERYREMSKTRQQERIAGLCQSSAKPVEFYRANQARGAATRFQRSEPARRRAADLALAGRNVKEIHREIGYSVTQIRKWLADAAIVPARICRPRGKPSAMLIDLTGQTFGELRVLRRAGWRGRRPTWLCVCACGRELEIEGQNLRGGVRWQKTSCGHEKQRVAEFRRAHRPERMAWKAMRRIGACARWESFEQFFADMGPRPKNHILTRISDEPHGPGVSVYMLRHRIVGDGGNEALSIAEWAERAGLSYSAVAKRLRRGWSLRRATETPSNGSSMDMDLRGLETELRKRLARHTDG